VSSARNDMLYSSCTSTRIQAALRARIWAQVTRSWVVIWKIRARGPLEGGGRWFKKPPPFLVTPPHAKTARVLGAPEPLRHEIEEVRVLPHCFWRIPHAALANWARICFWNWRMAAR
jgi:hypothetical protein